MKNYSWLEQKLHQFVLSTKFMREVTFDFESTNISYSFLNEEHIFIAGMARAGTTILMNALFKSNHFGSLSYADMPFVLAPNLWSKISPIKGNLEFKERAHGDGIKVSAESPEAFEEVFWKTFADKKEEELEEKFRIYVSNIIRRYKKQRYLSKNNQNLKRINLINSFFSNSIIFIPFRNPLQHSYSLQTQHLKFVKDAKNENFVAKYMKWIGHTEFGPNYIPIYNQNLNFNNYSEINHWLEQWILIYSYAFELLKNKQNVHFISYEKLCSDEDYWFDIQEIAKIEKPYVFEFKESKADISINIDKELKEKAFSLYFDLNSLDLK